MLLNSVMSRRPLIPWIAAKHGAMAIVMMIIDDSYQTFGLLILLGDRGSWCLNFPIGQNIEATLPPPPRNRTSYFCFDPLPRCRHALADKCTSM